VAKDYKTPAPEPCFKDVELQLDVFGSYTNAVSRSQHGDGFGGGIGVNYFFCRYLGVGVSGNLRDGDVNGVWNADASIIARYPLELGTFCLAPYILAGGGIETDSTTVGSWHAGGGLEWRATPSFGIFGEGRYTWAEDNDSASARVGLRFVF
jgi:opacity protein-like surface antigen